MTDEKPKGLSWVDEEQLAARIVRGEELTFDEMLYGLDQNRTVDSLIEDTLKLKGCHVRRG